MYIQTEISFEQAVRVSQTTRTQNKRRFEYLMQEIKDSDPTYLDAHDFNYYAGELTDNCQDGKTYTANEVRDMMREGKDIDRYDMIGTFIGDDTDSIIDYF